MKGVISWQDHEDWPLALHELEIDPCRTSLVIVDMQQSSANSPSGAERKHIVPNCALLQAFFRKNGLEVIYLRVGSFLSDRRDMHRKRALFWNRRAADQPPTPRHPGIPDHEVMKELAPRPGELVLDKNTNSAFTSSPLDTYLRGLDVQNLVVCGTSTANCVAATARGAADRGYNVILVGDACFDDSERDHRSTLSTFSRHFGAVKSSQQIVGELTALLGRELTDTEDGEKPHEH